MLKIETDKFGEVTAGEGDVLHLERGIPGFPDMRRVCLLRREEDEPIRWLLNLDDAAVAIPVVEARHIATRYLADIASEVCGVVGVKEIEDLDLYVILVIGSDPAGTTANLRAPILIDRQNGTARQVVLPSEEYPIRYRLFSELDPGAEEDLSANSG